MSDKLLFPRLFRLVDESDAPAWALQTDAGSFLLPAFSLADWLRSGTGRVDDAIQALIISALQSPPVALPEMLLPPIDTQEIWAAGVTYTRSRDARQEEAVDGGDVYARVYQAERPELFFKGSIRTARGHLQPLNIRHDSSWNVPEPELGVLLNPAMELAGLIIGNDMSSRSIEGENPLYLPQAKVYDASCGLGPAIALVSGSTLPVVRITLQIEGSETRLFEGDTTTGNLRRSLTELAGFLGRANTFDDGVFLLTGTGLVPPSTFTLSPGMMVSITIDGLGTLTNPIGIT